MRVFNDVYVVYWYINGRFFDVVFYNVFFNDFILLWYLYQKNFFICLKFENKLIFFVILWNS